MQYELRSIAGLLGLALLAACADSPVAPTELSPETFKGKEGKPGGPGTTITATISATGFLDRQTDYDWTLEKRVKAIYDDHMVAEPSVSETLVLPGHVRWIQYEFTATRTVDDVRTISGGRGSICVENKGTVATSDLAITAAVHGRTAGGQFDELETAPVDVSANPVLDPGESHCYPYEIHFGGPMDGQYRASADVTIDNYVGRSGAAFGPGAEDGMVAPFRYPSVVSLTTKDAEAVVHEAATSVCAAIFPSIICTGAGTLPVKLTETATFESLSTLDTYNFFVCGQEFDFTNVATLVESGPHQSGTAPETSTAMATIRIETGVCPPKPAEPGCTYTQGYWKNHEWPEHPLWKPTTLANWPDIEGWKFFDSDLEWPDVLDTPVRGNAYLILAHQYVAAILNQQNGTWVPENVRETLMDAYNYFRLSESQRAATSREDLIRWAELLDRYNNGLLGVPHCG